MDEDLQLGEWDDNKQKKYEAALAAYFHSHGRNPTLDDMDEIWIIILNQGEINDS